MQSRERQAEKASDSRNEGGTRVVNFVSPAFRSMDYEKRETARSLDYISCSV